MTRLRTTAVDSLLTRRETMQLDSFGGSVGRFLARNDVRQFLLGTEKGLEETRIAVIKLNRA